MDAAASGEGRCGYDFPAGDVETLANLIDWYREEPDHLRHDGEDARKVAEKYEWPIIRERYKKIWREMLG